MKIRRFFGKDMREALSLVTQELGPDAVILSNKRTNSGVEVVAATDYDEQAVRAQAVARPAVKVTHPEAEHPVLAAPDSALVEPAMPAEATADERALSSLRTDVCEEMRLMRALLEEQLAGLAWNDTRRRHPHKSMLLERLARLGIAPSITQQICGSLEYRDSVEATWQAALLQLAQSVQVTNDDILTRGGIVALVGTTGVGKTTTIAKLAARYALAHGADSVALISTDCYRIAAHEQLKTFGQILGCPVRLVDKPEALRRALDAFAHKRLVLIDTAGTGQRDQQLAERLELIVAQGQPVRNYLVLSCTAQRTMLDESVRAFGRLPLAGCVLTKLDEAGSLGDMISTLIQHNLAVSYIADGQRVPEDLRIARSVNLINQAISLAKHHNEAHDTEILARYARAAGLH